MDVRTMGLTPETPERLLVESGAVWLNYGTPQETKLGATRGGNVFEPGITVREIEVDGAPGPVKGLRRVERIAPVLRTNLVEFGHENLKRALPGMYSELVDEDAQAATYDIDLTGSDADTFKLKDSKLGTSTWELNGESTAAEIKQALDALYGPGVVASVELRNAVATELVITFEMSAGQPGLKVDSDDDDGASIVGDEEFNAGEAYHKLTQGEVTLDHYVENVALVGTVTGRGTPVVIILYNVLGSGELSLNFTPRDEVVSEVVFQGHYDVNQLDLVPFEIRWPVG